MDPKTLPPLSLFKHRLELQLRFNDIDILGHLNNTVYFSFYDTGKARYFEAIKGGNIDFRKVETVIANVDCAYISPIYFGENIEVYTRCLSIHDRSFRLQQVIVNSDTGEIKSAAETVMVAFDAELKKAISMPPGMRADLEKAMDEEARLQ